MPLARLFESMLLVCPNCGADMRIIDFVTDDMQQGMQHGAARPLLALEVPAQAL